MHYTIVYSYLIDPIAVLDGSAEVFSSNAVINTFFARTFERTFVLSCFATNGSADLTWQSRNVSGLDDGEIALAEVESLRGVNVTVNTGQLFDRDFISLAVNVTGGLYTGYYACRSRQTNSTIEVFATLTNPLWRTLTPSSLSVPMGAEVELTIQYADRSTGAQNRGRGFMYNLRFLPCVATLPDQTLQSGTTDEFANDLAYSFRARLGDDSGEFVWNGELKCS